MADEQPGTLAVRQPLTIALPLKLQILIRTGSTALYQPEEWLNSPMTGDGFHVGWQQSVTSLYCKASSYTRSTASKVLRHKWSIPAISYSRTFFSIQLINLISCSLNG